MKTAGKKNPALVELILVILFFSLSSTVLVQLFVRAKDMSETSRAQTMGLVFAQDWIEQWKANPAHPETVFLADEGWKEEDSTEGGPCFSIEIDENMQTGLTEAGIYEVWVRLNGEGRDAGKLCKIAVSIVRKRDQREILELETAAYLSGQEAG